MVKEDKVVLDNVSPTQEVIDISIPAIKKKSYSINGSNPIEINTSDVGIIQRLEKTYDKLDKLAKEASTELADSIETGEQSEFDEVVKASKALQKIDSQMRALIDEIFNAPVSEACTPTGQGTMFDPLNGEFRFEHIIRGVAGLYEGNLTEEFNKVSLRMKKHTGKYTGK